MDDPGFMSILSRATGTFLERHQLKNAFSPIVYLCLIASPSCFGAAAFFRDDSALKWFLVIVGVLPILVGAVIYVYFAFTNPGKLQSEGWQIQQETLQMLQKKGGKIAMLPVDATSVASPIARSHIEGPK